MNRPQPSLEEVDRAARQLIAQYSWRSVDGQRLAGRVAELIARGTDLDGPYGLERLCEQAAAEQLFAGCERGSLRSATAGEKRLQEDAYQDLGNYLFARGRRQLAGPAPGVPWQAVVEETLGDVHAGLASCKAPNALLAFAMVILKRKCAATWRRRGWHVEHEQSLPDTDEAVQELGAAQHDPSGSADAEGEGEIFTIIGSCLRTIEQRIVALALVLGLKRREILLAFADLGSKYDNVRRALANRLGRCRRFQAWVHRDAATQVCGLRDCPWDLPQRGAV